MQPHPSAGTNIYTQVRKLILFLKYFGFLTICVFAENNILLDQLPVLTDSMLWWKEGGHRNAQLGARRGCLGQAAVGRADR